MSEAEFWERYFSSKLFDRHRASSRNSVAKEDAIFDKYLEREDDGMITSSRCLVAVAEGFEKTLHHYMKGINASSYYWIWRRRKLIMER